MLIEDGGIARRQIIAPRSGVDEKRRHVVAPINAPVCGDCEAALAASAGDPENAPVCNMGGLALARPAGEADNKSFHSSLFIFTCYLLPINC